jgi:hypothetical protein
MNGIPIATCGTIYDDPTTGIAHMLVFGQALFFGDRIKGSLVPPNQIRASGHIVSDVPKQFDRRSSHSIHFQDDNEDLVIPLELRGVISGFLSRKPTQHEIDHAPRNTWNTLPNFFHGLAASMQLTSPRMADYLTGLLQTIPPGTIKGSAAHAESYAACQTGETNRSPRMIYVTTVWANFTRLTPGISLLQLRGPDPQQWGPLC